MKGSDNDPKALIRIFQEHIRPMICFLHKERVDAVDFLVKEICVRVTFMLAVDPFFKSVSSSFDVFWYENVSERGVKIILSDAIYCVKPKQSAIYLTWGASAFNGNVQSVISALNTTNVTPMMGGKIALDWKRYLPWISDLCQWAISEIKLHQIAEQDNE